MSVVSKGWCVSTRLCRPAQAGARPPPLASARAHHPCSPASWRGLSLIVAIGAQNAFVLRQGIRREHVGPVALLCSLADALLIGAGVLGIGTLVERAPVVLDIVRWGGVVFLLCLCPARAAPRRTPRCAAGGTVLRGRACERRSRPLPR